MRYREETHEAIPVLYVGVQLEVVFFEDGFACEGWEPCWKLGVRFFVGVAIDWFVSVFSASTRFITF